MSIEFSCTCGRGFRVRDELAGRRGKCPDCGAVLEILKAEPPPPPDPDAPIDIYDVADPVVQEKTQVVATPSDSEDDDEEESSPARAGSTVAPGPMGAVRRWTYLAFGLALIPLMLSLFAAPQRPVIERLRDTLHAHPEVRSRVQATLSGRFRKADLFDALPGHRLEGAWLEYGSMTHWLYAILAAGAFFGLALLLLPRSDSKPLHVFLTGLFTGTAGVLLLLGIQMIAGFMRGRIVIPRSVVGLFFLALKGIQLSYDAANDPNSNFFVSAMGFTFGVGLCEEICKALPLLWHYRNRATLDWRGACLWGFLSGVGFGISEAVMYSADFYNGSAGGEMYVVRFISCVALHGIWAAAAGIFICKHQNLIQDVDSVLNTVLSSVALVSAPMVLHGLYDTMLKKQMNGAALVIAIISFGWLVWQIETSWRQESPAGALAVA